MKTLKLFENFDSEKNNRENFAKLVDNVFSMITDDERWDNIFSINIDEYLTDEDAKIYISALIEDGNIHNFGEFHKVIKQKFEIVDKINSCLELLDKYSENEVGTIFYYGDESIELSLYEIYESGDFWYKQKSGKIKLDYSKIIKLIGSPSVKIGTSSDGTNSYMVIDSQEPSGEARPTQWHIFKKLYNLKIDGKPLVVPIDKKENFDEKYFKLNPDINIDRY